jgi:hypothetical protein
MSRSKAGLLRPNGFLLRLRHSMAAGESVSLHAPSQQIEAVLPEKRLAVEDHQWDAPMPGAFLRGLIFGDHSFITIGIALDF